MDLPNQKICDKLESNKLEYQYRARIVLVTIFVCLALSGAYERSLREDQEPNTAFPYSAQTSTALTSRLRENF